MPHTVILLALSALTGAILSVAVHFSGLWAMNSAPAAAAVASFCAAACTGLVLYACQR